MSARTDFFSLKKYPFIVVCLTFILSACGGGNTPAAVTFTNGQAAAVVIGQPDFISSGINQGGAVAAYTMYAPYGNALVDSGKLYVGEYSNNRTLVYNSIPSISNTAADFAIGQPDLTSNTGSPPASATTAGGPEQPLIYNGKFIVPEYDNNRISIYNTIPTASPGTVDVVVGQPDKVTSTVVSPCTSSSIYGPETAAMAGGRLVVTDSSNNRVLIWNTLPTVDNQPADLVLGQADFISNGVNRGSTPAANTFNYPAGVWSDGTRLVVQDANNNRILIWNTFPTTNGQPADLVLGQPDFTSNSANQGGGTTASAKTLNRAMDGVFFTGNQLFVTDMNNNRLLVWNSFPTVNDQAADRVIGQPDFVTTTSMTTATGLTAPDGVVLNGKQLIVTDSGNNRVLIYNGL